MLINVGILTILWCKMSVEITLAPEGFFVRDLITAGLATLAYHIGCELEIVGNKAIIYCSSKIFKLFTKLIFGKEVDPYRLASAGHCSLMVRGSNVYLILGQQIGGRKERGKQGYWAQNASQEAVNAIKLELLHDKARYLSSIMGRKFWIDPQYAALVTGILERYTINIRVRGENYAIIVTKKEPGAEVIARCVREILSRVGRACSGFSTNSLWLEILITIELCETPGAKPIRLYCIKDLGGGGKPITLWRLDLQVSPSLLRAIRLIRQRYRRLLAYLIYDALDNPSDRRARDRALVTKHLCYALKYASEGNPYCLDEFALLRDLLKPDAVKTHEDLSEMLQLSNSVVGRQLRQYSAEDILNLIKDVSLVVSNYDKLVMW